MSGTPTVDPSVIEAAARRFRAAWKRGLRPRIEDFLAEVGESSWPTLLQELIRVESDLRRRAGETTSAEEYRRRFPEYARAVDSVFGPEPVPSGEAGRPSGSTTGEPGAGAAPATASGLLAELQSKHDYEIVRELGRGGMGVVYLAHNRLMGRDEVLKVIGEGIIDKPGVLDRFQREIRAVAKLRHPNIVSAYSAFRCSGSLVLSMEYVNGLDLRRMVRAKGPLPVGHACNFAYQAASGLQHAHEQGMVHRDIKPSNLMLSDDGGRAVIKLLDFGLAKATREQGGIELVIGHQAEAADLGGGLTRVGQMLGSPDFIAPEQILDAQQSDIRADIYSLGCTLYCLLCGQPPFQEMTLADVLEAHRSVDASRLDDVRADVPAELAAVVAKMMAKQPGRRFQLPADVARALTPFFKKSALAQKSSRVATSPTIGPTAGQTLIEAGPAAISDGPGRGLTPDGTKPPKKSVPGASGSDAGDWEVVVRQPPPRPTRDPEPPLADLAPGKDERPPLYRSPTFVAAIVLTAVAILGCGFVTWYLGRAKFAGATDRNVTAEGEVRTGEAAAGITIEAPPMEGAPVKKTPPTLVELLALGAPRTVAPEAAEIGGATVSVETAAVGRNDRQPKGDCLSIGLRITNVSQKPIHHRSWSGPGVTVILRDHNGAFYNRLTAPDDRETAIDPGRTVVETLLFEATPAGATLYLDLPNNDGAKPFLFRIPFQFIQRSKALTQLAPRPAAASSSAPAPAPPSTPPPAGEPKVAADVEKKEPADWPPLDPEKDPRLKAALVTEYRAGIRTIKSRALGMSRNEANRFKRTAPKELLKSLAKKHNLKLEQVQRIVGAE
ncbi:MAG: serine/threonine protein kinase [Isosphaeraceae bacterium]